MPKTNEATDTDLKVIEMLRHLGWKRGDTGVCLKLGVIKSVYG